MAIDVRKNGSDLMWLVEANVPYNTTLTVSEGCGALVFCDGAIYDVLYQGSRKDINEKKFFGKPMGTRWSVYGVNTSQQIRLLWGIDTRYSDKSMQDAHFVIRANGECKARIENAQVLFNALVSEEGNVISPDLLLSTLRPKLCSIANDVINQIANELRDHNQIQGARTKIADEIKKRVANSLADNYGMYLVESIVSVLHFDGIDEYLEKIRGLALMGFDVKKTQMETEQMKMVAEAAKAFDKNDTAPAAQPQQPLPTLELKEKK